MTEHTPTPWSLSGAKNDILSADYTVLACFCDREDDYTADAEFIVRACNSHDEMAEVVEDFIRENHSDSRCRYCDVRVERGHTGDCFIPAARAALAKAKKAP